MYSCIRQYEKDSLTFLAPCTINKVCKQIRVNRAILVLVILQLHLHTGDVSDVYPYIPPECLPKDFGGELDCVASLHGKYTM